MDFHKAYKNLLNGEKITCSNWTFNQKYDYLELNEIGALCYNDATGSGIFDMSDLSYEEFNSKWLIYKPELFERYVVSYPVGHSNCIYSSLVTLEQAKDIFYKYTIVSGPYKTSKYSDELFIRR